MLSLPACYLFSRRDILLDHGFLNENYHLALDLEFWLRIGKYEDFLRVPEQLAAAREYTSNKSNSFPSVNRSSFEQGMCTLGI